MLQTGDLDVSLLYAIMARAGEMRGRRKEYVGIDELLDLVAPSENTEKREARLHLHRHLMHLRDREFIYYHPIAAEWGTSTFKIKTKGELFVQPELAEFGTEPLLPQVVKSLEKSIDVLTYPEEEKNGMLFRLRDAISKEAPEVIAKVITEVCFKIMSGGR
jgi:hypothetical protein